MTQIPHSKLGLCYNLTLFDKGFLTKSPSSIRSQFKCAVNAPTLNPSGNAKDLYTAADATYRVRRLYSLYLRNSTPSMQILQP